MKPQRGFLTSLAPAAGRPIARIGTNFAPDETTGARYARSVPSRAGLWPVNDTKTGDIKMRISNLILAAGLLGLGTTAAMAKTEKFTLVGNDGTVYCDGLTLTTTDKVVYNGIHTGSCESAQPADGFATKIKGYVPVIDVATQYTGSPATYTFILSAKVGAWELLTDEGGVFTVVNYGTLAKGAPPAAPGAPASNHPK